MQKAKVIFAVVILVASLVLIFDKLFTPQPIQITLESGREVSTENATYFSLTEALLLVICSFLTGVSTMYLYNNADLESLPILQGPAIEEQYKPILGLLKDDERAVMKEVLKGKGEALQNDLVNKLGVSKVKVTRILSRLERKGLVTRQRHGFTNKILLKK